MSEATFGDPRLPERFWSKATIAPNGCWLWLAYKDRHQYGKVGWQGRTQAAYKVAYLVLIGPVPTGMVLDHACHNLDPTCPSGVECPHRPCVNPNHLEIATQRQNVQRGFLGRDLCRKGHPLFGDNLMLVSTNSSRGVRRFCRACDYERSHRNYRRRNPLT